MRTIERFGSFSLLTRAVAASVFVAVIVAAAFALLFVALSNLSRSTDVQAHTRDVTTATLGVQQVVNQLESSLRAYVLNGDPRFRNAWRRARNELEPSLADLNGLVVQEPDELANSEELSSLARQYVTEYGAPLIGIYAISPKAARSPVATREGGAEIEGIRAHLDGLLKSEAAHASSDATTSKNAAARAARIGVAALAAAAALLALYALFLVRWIAVPVKSVADAATRVAAGDLSTRLSEQGPAEIRSLTKAFNAMARSLEQNRRELAAEKEELRQSERLKAQLVSIVSHELRTPLTSILGYARLLRNRELDREQTAKYLTVIQEQGTRLTDILDHFLDSESVESGQLDLELETFDLRELLARETQLVADTATTHQIEIVGGGEQLPVCADRDRIAQVFGNLLGNAVKYSPDGGLVEVSGWVHGATARVEVRDQGIGVSREHHSRIFTKFFRGDAPESGIPGTGLGLSVSREIVEAHGGRVGFESTPGSGSCFWFELPLTEEPAQERSRHLAGVSPGLGLVGG
jgi:signal transduction histidine kinase